MTIPPLRERKDDLPLLSRYFLEDFNNKTGKEYRGFTATACGLFKITTGRKCPRVGAFNIVKPSIINSPDEEGLLKIEPYSSPSATERALPYFSGKTLPEIMLETERKAIMQALQEHDSNITQASAALGITRQSLQYRMSKLEITVGREATVSLKSRSRNNYGNPGVNPAAQI